VAQKTAHLIPVGDCHSVWPEINLLFRTNIVGIVRAVAEARAALADQTGLIVAEHGYKSTRGERGYQPLG
jgi:hypothetical protein